jgi:nucleoside 2-deoxyribosyltransferase
MLKIYLGGPMFSAADVQYNRALADRLRALGFEVYCPNENASINDKTRSDLTGEAIYLADIRELESSNIFLCQVAEDSGTMWEAGYMNCLARHVNPKRYFGTIGLATDIRLRTLPNPRQSIISMPNSLAPTAMTRLKAPMFASSPPVCRASLA